MDSRKCARLAYLNSTQLAAIKAPKPGRKLETQYECCWTHWVQNVQMLTWEKNVQGTYYCKTDGKTGEIGSA